MNKKQLLIFIAGIWLLAACDRELKEHPLPPEMKRQMEMANDPAVQAKVIAGTIAMDPELAAQAPETVSLFIFVRPPGVTAGPPLAVKRILRTRLPYEFKIGPMDVMIPDTPFEGELNLTARIDRDGNAKSSPGDIEGSLITRAGEKTVRLVLNTLIPEPRPEETTITGTVALDPKLKPPGSVPENAYLFIYARARGVQGGPPLAVKLEKNVRFPFKFQLGPDDIMMPGVDFSGDVTLIARLDQDGNAKTSPGDMEGYIPATVGDKDVTVMLDKFIGPPETGTNTAGDSSAEGELSKTIVGKK